MGKGGFLNRPGLVDGRRGFLNRPGLVDGKRGVPEQAGVGRWEEGVPEQPEVQGSWKLLVGCRGDAQTLQNSSICKINLWTLLASC